MISCKNTQNKEDGKAPDSTKTENSAKADVEYTCPMHPQVMTKQPGKCPECQMELQVRS